MERETEGVRRTKEMWGSIASDRSSTISRQKARDVKEVSGCVQSRHGGETDSITKFFFACRMKCAERDGQGAAHLPTLRGYKVSESSGELGPFPSSAWHLCE